LDSPPQRIAETGADAALSGIGQRNAAAPPAFPPLPVQIRRAFFSAARHVGREIIFYILYSIYQKRKKDKPKAKEKQILQKSY